MPLNIDNFHDLRKYHVNDHEYGKPEQLKVGPEHNEEGIINRFVLRFSTDS